MAEPIPHADDAAAYVLGTLGARDRRRFEARLKKSPELQKVVRLLEAGSIGLALAAPRREPPIRLWAGIQTAVTHECEKRRRSAKRIWLHSAAGIAACTVMKIMSNCSDGCLRMSVETPAAVSHSRQSSSMSFDE